MSALIDNQTSNFCQEKNLIFSQDKDVRIQPQSTYTLFIDNMGEENFSRAFKKRNCRDMSPDIVTLSRI